MRSVLERAELMDLTLTDVPCPVCGILPAEAFLDVLSQRLQASKRSFKLSRCVQCGLVLTSPRPSTADMDWLYNNEYFLPVRGGLGTKIGDLTTRERASFVQKYVRSGSVLDIGCGLGGFLANLPSNRFEVSGLEPYQGLFASVVEPLRSRIQFKPFDTADLAENAFDLITLWHVLEHMPQPLKALEKVFRLLKPGGCLILEVPNLASLEARWLGPFWYHLDVPFHFWHFTPSSLRTMVSKAGFRVEAQPSFTLTRPILLLNYLILGANSMHSWCRAALRLPSGLLDRAVRAACVPVCALERFALFFSTPTMRLVARKPIQEHYS